MKQIVSKEQLSRMTIDLSTMDWESPMTEQYPQLQRLSTFADCERPDKDALIRYILLMYDPKSPYKDLISDIKQRKVSCAHAAALEECREIFEFLDREFIEMLDEWLKSINSRVWSMIVSNEQVFYEYQSRLLIPVADSEKGDKETIAAADLKAKLMDTCDEIHNRLEGYYRELYGDKETADKIRQNHRWTPENIGQV